MAHGWDTLIGTRHCVTVWSPRTATVWWCGPCGSPTASREMRSSPPHPRNCGEMAGQGGGSGSSPEQHRTWDGCGGGGVPGDGGGSYGPQQRRPVIQLKGL
jgi:hypothetical protein